MNKIMILGAIMALTMIGFSCTDDNDNNGGTTISNKQKVVERLKSIETGDTASNAYMNPNKYIQHNLAIKDGHAGFEEVMAMLPPGSARVNTVRVFEDGDYVIAHTDYDFFGPTIGIDIFRFENGLIVEHWDNLQPTPETNNPSGRSMVDGETRLTDLDQTRRNKRLVEEFVREILIERDMDELDGYFDGDNYIQHNPTMSDGVSGFRAAFAEMEANGVQKTYTRIHRVFGEGNFVLVVSEGVFNGNPTAYYDLYRVANDRIAEHWDVIETIPPRSEWQNQNGKFNFPF